MYLGVAFLVRVGFCVGRVGTWLSVRGGLVLGQLKKNKVRKKNPSEPNPTPKPSVAFTGEPEEETNGVSCGQIRLNNGPKGERC